MSPSDRGGSRPQSRDGYHWQTQPETATDKAGVGMGRTWQTLWTLALMLALAAFISAACGSADEPSAVQVQEQAGQQTDQQAEPVGPQPPEPDDDQGDAAATPGVTMHKGLVAQGKVLGDPDAPVVIRYYGDFQ